MKGKKYNFSIKKMEVRVLLMCIVVLPHFNGCIGQNRTDVENLYSFLLRDNYNKYVRPTENQSTATSVRVDLQVTSLRDLDDVSGLFSVVAFIKIYWTDDSMVWTPSSYNGLKQIHFPQSDVWRPELTLANPFSELKKFGYNDVLVQYTENGAAQWVIGDVLDATCEIDVTYFPFDKQTCKVFFLIWGYQKSHVQMVPVSDTVDMTSLTESGQWVITKTSAYAIDTTVPYICFEFTMNRRSEYFIVNVFIPVLLLTMLSTMVFILPSDSGERVGYSITCLLSIAVFLTIVSANLPKSSKPVSILGLFLVLDLILATTFSVLTILGLWMYHKSDDTSIPRPVYYFVYVTRCFCCRKKQHPKINPELFDTGSDVNVSDSASVIKGNEKKQSNVTVKWKDVSKTLDIFCFIFGNGAVTGLMVIYLMVANLV